MMSAILFFVFYFGNDRRPHMDNGALYWFAGLYLATWLIEKIMARIPGRFLRPVFETMATGFDKLGKRLRIPLGRTVDATAPEEHNVRDNPP